jgi:protocatechuate 3,4-dioxygenase beta subunit/DNA uptake protein ComE-like DNA-binding protein
MIGVAAAQDDAMSDIPEFIDPVEAAGDVLILYGQVLDTNGDPVEAARVEIWQTDSFGVYDHPNADRADSIDAGFQHFGSSITDADGNYSFRTVVPSSEGIGRPLHIHFKIWLDDEELLTSQFYFASDSEGSRAENVLLSPEPVSENDDSVLVAQKDIVDPLGDGDLEPVSADIEGPFYPVVDLAEYDNDLAVTSEQDITTADQSIEFTLFNLNTATADDYMTIPNFSSRMVREFFEYRPYISIQQFRREIGKYVDDSVVAAYEEYVYVPVNVDESDAETLKQLPGVDDDIAAALIAGRPYGSNDAFLEALSGHVSTADLAAASNYLASEA